MELVKLDGITKRYRVGVGRARIREMLPWPLDAGCQRLFPKWWLRHTFNALEDVTINIEAGSSVGLIGHNGAGKTTLLKIIAQVTSPTAGRVKVNGRVAALLDAIVGFHPELTGRENAFLLGAMHGFSRKQMRERVDEILEFAGIGDMADTPVKRYSVGMTARLGFAIVTALDPDLLLIDEILAVGDASFQKQCIEWLDGYRRRGGTLIFVSHNLGLVRNMTDTAVWLDHGTVVEQGTTAALLPRYAQAIERRDTGHPGYKKGKVAQSMGAQQMYRWGAGGARLEEVNVTPITEDGSELQVSISYESSGAETALFSIGFVDENERELGAGLSEEFDLGELKGSLNCHLGPLPLRSGIYFPVVCILSPDGIIRDRWRLDRAVVIDRAETIDIPALGSVQLPTEWSNGTGRLDEKAV